LNLPLLKGCSIVGVFWGNFTRREPEGFLDQMRQLAAWYAEGRIKPHISARYPLDRAPEALRLMADRKVTGKVILTA
jgi:NADPH2:quinone reductase